MRKPKATKSKMQSGTIMAILAKSPVTQPQRQPPYNQLDQQKKHQKTPKLAPA
jgi:hypothetical protein